MAYVSVAGRRVRYELTGRGDAPTLMFSNSIGASLEMWDEVAALLASDFAVLRYDNRGHGGSDPEGGPATIDDLAADAIAVIKAAGRERVHFVGLSLGGMVAQALAIRHPEHLEMMTACATGAALLPSSAWEDRAQIALTTGMEPFVAISAERWFTPRFRAERPEAVETALGMIRATDAASYAACCRVIRDTDFRSELGSITVPTLLIAGRDDPATPPAKLEEIAGAVKGAELVVLDQAAHILSIEQPEATSAAIRRFVEARLPRGGSPSQRAPVDAEHRHGHKA